LLVRHDRGLSRTEVADREREEIRVGTEGQGSAGRFRHVAEFRLVATDVDGTLLRSDGNVSAYTAEVLRRVRDAGVEVTLVSARAPLWLNGVIEDLGIVSGYAVCSNGAVVYDIGRQTALLHHTLTSEVARRIVEALREAAPGVAFACERESLTVREPGYVPLWATPGMDERHDALAFTAEPVSKLIVQHPRLSQDELYAFVAGICGDEATATISGEVLVEISAAGVTKAYALSALCEEIDVQPQSVVAFGDMPNDIPMLAWAGRAIAVENAHPDVIAVADEVTAANDEDGVAIALERLVLADAA
jgi:Cof subfamily protein (haloacid dehalogenase superfamily)